MYHTWEQLPGVQMSAALFGTDFIAPMSLLVQRIERRRL
jgi:hypothetical protein